MTLEIIHLKQIHASPSLPNYDEEHYLTLPVVHAQFDIAKYLLLNVDIPVIVENLLNDQIAKTPNENELLLPNGLPSQVSQLTHVQKVVLYKFGAAMILAHDGLLPIIYKSIDAADARKVESKYSQMSIRAFNTQGEREEDPLNRENFALDNAERVAKLHYRQQNEGKVIIIFGVHHDFKKECDERGYKLTEISVDTVKEYIEWQDGANNISSYEFVGSNAIATDL